MLGSTFDVKYDLKCEVDPRAEKVNIDNGLRLIA